jgi:hypothetical protein
MPAEGKDAVPRGASSERLLHHSLTRRARGGTCGRAPAQDLVPGAGCGPFRRHASEQYRTPSQSRSHFFRHVNGRWHDTQVFGGGTFGRLMGGMGGWLTAD